ncbi:hypothetical protein DIPPA_05953 [Diplonema papillatum]|nr:hypothetical protein DIPPA_05953 [Diplonema papillatum]
MRRPTELEPLAPRRSGTGSASSPLLGAARVGSAHPASCAGDPSHGVFAALQHHVVGKDDVVVQLKRQLAARDRQLAEATTDARTSRLRCMLTCTARTQPESVCPPPVGERRLDANIIHA